MEAASSDQVANKTLLSDRRKWTPNSDSSDRIILVVAVAIVVSTKTIKLSPQQR
jgi:ribosomal protein L13